MNFTDIFIKRPVLAVSISLLLTILGLNALKTLQIREYPYVVYTDLAIKTEYHGADADTVAGLITQPIQQAVAKADSLDYIKSTTVAGLSSITAKMRLNTDPNSAMAEILSLVNSVRSDLPSGAEETTVELSNESEFGNLYIAFKSNTMSTAEITDFINRNINPLLYTTPGLSQIITYGGSNFALRIWFDPDKLQGYKLSINEVMAVIQANNYITISGSANGMYTFNDTSVKTQTNSIESLENLIITSINGSEIRIKDVAQVSLETSYDKIRALYNDQTSVTIELHSSKTANPIEVVKYIREQVYPQMQKALVPGLDMDIVYDFTQPIQESIDEVIQTIIESTIIVLIVIILFLGSFRTVIIPVITIPLSLIGVLLIMQMVGFTINLLTLLAMILAIGLVVDDAIVVVENIDRHIKLGKSPFKAAIEGTREIAIPVISMTITLAAVYSPIALTPGVTGILFSEFALTLAGSVFISGIIALTLSPMMCSKLLKSNDEPSSFEQKIHSTLNIINNKYNKMLKGLLNHRISVVCTAIIIFITLPFMYAYSKFELTPTEDKSAIMILGIAPNNANLDFIEDSARKVARITGKYEYTSHFFAMSGMPGPNQSLTVAVLKPIEERDKSAQEIVKVFQNEFNLNVNPNMKQTPFLVSTLPGATFGLPVNFVISTSNSYEKLFEVSQNVQKQIDESGLFVYSTKNLDYDFANINIIIEREKAAAFGITMKDIGIVISSFLSEADLATVSISNRAYKIIPQVKRDLRQNIDEIAKFPIKTKNGEIIPLGTIVKFETKPAPRALYQMNQQNSVTFSLMQVPGISMGEVIDFFENTVIPSLPQGYIGDYTGDSRQYVKEGNSLVSTFILAILIIYLVLACQFESWRDPLVILVSVPLAISGALAIISISNVISLFYPGIAITMNIYTQVGLITLVGLISKHGILICEVAKQVQINQGLSKFEAIQVAAATRLRPILMTTAAMVAGLLPLVVATGSGAESRYSIGVVIVAGLAIGTCFTLFILPVIYTFIGQEHKKKVFETDIDESKSN